MAASYLSKIQHGLKVAQNLGDGYGINLTWFQAVPSTNTLKMAYHIYYSVNEKNVFSEGVKYVSNQLSADIYDLQPSQLYHFAVRAVEYNPSLVSYTDLPTTFNVLKVYPESVLTSNITATSTTIPLLDTETFPSSGIIKIGYELINYTSKDASNLYLTNAGIQRGFLRTTPRTHNVDGYDGVQTLSPYVTYILGREEGNTNIFPCEANFQYPTYAFTIPDGYHQVTKDTLTTDLSGSDALNVDFPSYDYAGWHRTDPTLLLSGDCVGSYFGGQQYCADGYSGVGRVLRGLSFQDTNNQRQDMLLSLTGEPVVLMRRQWTGITCACYMPNSEYGDDRCPKCFGQKYVVGFEQYYNPRRSDGRIMARFSPAEDDIKMYEAGMESELIADCWTLTVPTIKDRDFIVRFDESGNEEFRYEVLSVNRNRTLSQLEGAQKFRVQRIRKFDPLYRVPVFRNTKFLPQKLSTSVSSSIGLPSHTHDLVISEQITNINQINQLTSIAFGHQHIFRNGICEDTGIGHVHTIIF